ncbi:MAG: hypothetical protein VKJ24_10080 [Synechococcales bacterium]|nr:hypothetical protein [Synechococcales bacterium]
MKVLQAAQLEEKGIPYRGVSRLRIDGRLFHKGESFSKRVYSVALERCRAEQAQGVECLLVEMGEHVTLWREIEPPKNRWQDPRSLSEGWVLDKEHFNSSTTSVPPEKLLSKKSTRNLR